MSTRLMVLPQRCEESGEDDLVDNLLDDMADDIETEGVCAACVCLSLARTNIHVYHLTLLRSAGLIHGVSLQFESSI